MKYRITYTCCSKTYQIDLSLVDYEFSDEDMDSFVLNSIKHYKEEDGLEDFSHEIIKSEISIDEDTWYTTEKFMNLI